MLQLFRFGALESYIRASIISIFDQYACGFRIRRIIYRLAIWFRGFPKLGNALFCIMSIGICGLSDKLLIEFKLFKTIISSKIKLINFFFKHKHFIINNYVQLVNGF